jgi:PAS domain S-box-containing protein
MAKTVILERKPTLIIIRFVILILIICFVSYSPDDRATLYSGLVVSLIGIYLLSQFVLILLNQDFLFKLYVQVCIFLLDIGLLTSIIYLTQGFNQDLYLIYFLTIFMAGMGRNNKQVLLVAFVSSLAYSVVILRTIQSFDKIEAYLLLRIPLLFLVALFNNYYMTQLQRKQEELKNMALNKEQLEKKIIMMLSELPDGTIITDREFNILMINHAAENFFGVQQKNVIGRNLAEITLAFKPSASWKELKNSPAMTLNFELVRREGKYLHLSVLLSKAIGDKKGVSAEIMIVRDITDQKTEETLKSNFLSAISHKLKTPLTTIIGNALIIKDDEKFMSGLSGEQTAILAAITEKSLLLSGLVDKLLRFSMFESNLPDLKREKTRITDAINATLAEFTRTPGSREVAIELDDSIKDLPEVYADRKKLSEVFSYLLDNGSKFNDKTDKKIWIGGTRKDPLFVQVEVRDNGMGILPEEREKIFRGFYQVENSFTGQVEGIGLGLYLSRQIIELNGGRIWAESVPGKETRMCFTVPAVMEKIQDGLNLP